MQRIGKLVLDVPRALLPVQGLLDPIRAIGNVGPGADLGDAPDQSADVALGLVDAVDLARDPI